MVLRLSVFVYLYYSNKMYEGHSQQDSHEVFRTILDCIKNEECEVCDVVLCILFRGLGFLMIKYCEVKPYITMTLQY